MTGDCHVRFYQRLGAKLPRPTNHDCACINANVDTRGSYVQTYAESKVRSAIRA
jgi:hypothetical protein